MTADRSRPGTLLCDVDGVVYPYVERLKPILERVCGRALPDVFDYDLRSAWKVTDDEQHRAHHRLFRSLGTHQPAPITCLPPVDHAAETLHRLYARGARIVFITRRAHYTESIGGSFKRAAKLTSRWLRLWAPPHELVHVTDKAAYDEPYSLLLDDNPAEAAAVAATGRRVWLLAQPYNNVLDSAIPRVTWADPDIDPVVLHGRSTLSAGTR